MWKKYLKILLIFDIMGIISFLHLDDLIVLPAIYKINDTYVKCQLKELYTNKIIELCDAKPLVKKVEYLTT